MSTRSLLLPVFIFIVITFGITFYLSSDIFKDKKEIQSSEEIITQSMPQGKPGQAPSETILLPNPFSAPVETIINKQTVNPAAIPAPIPYSNSIENSSFEENVSELLPDELFSIVLDWSTPQNKKTLALNELLGQIHNNPDKSAAMNMLLDLKDSVTGQDQQSVLQALTAFAAQGGNEAIIDSFFMAQDESTIEQTRILTYIDSHYPLPTDSVQQLTYFYQNQSEGDLQQGLLNVLATSGGEYGVSWVIENVAAPIGSDQWFIMVDSLSRSNSQQAYQHLQETMKELKQTTSTETAEKQMLRAAIKQLQSNLEQPSE